MENNTKEITMKDLKSYIGIAAAMLCNEKMERGIDAIDSDIMHIAAEISNRVENHITGQNPFSQKYVELERCAEHVVSKMINRTNMTMCREWNGGRIDG